MKLEFVGRVHVSPHFRAQCGQVYILANTTNQQFPLIPGHETVGVIAALGKDVKGFQIGDRVAADNSELCNECFYCRRGQLLLCEKFEAHGVTSTLSSSPTVPYTAANIEECLKQ